MNKEKLNSILSKLDKEDQQELMMYLKALLYDNHRSILRMQRQIRELQEEQNYVRYDITQKVIQEKIYDLTEKVRERSELEYEDDF